MVGRALRLPSLILGKRSACPTNLRPITSPMAHPPRIPVWLRWNQEVVYFLTFCVAKRQNVLANDKTFGIQICARSPNKLEYHRCGSNAGSTCTSSPRLTIATHRWAMSPEQSNVSCAEHWAPSGNGSRAALTACSARMNQPRRNCNTSGKIRCAWVGRNWQDWPYRVGFEL